MSAPSLLHPSHTGQIRKLFFGISASLVILFSASCAGVEGTSTETVSLVDPDATAETRALFVNLRKLAPDHVLFGHQDDLAYGVTWKREDGRSDVKETAGSFPAVYGWEIGDFENDVEVNLDGVRFDDMRRWIQEGYDRGGVITLSWHMDNPVSKGDAWDTTRAVYSLLPGGENHEWFKSCLDRFAEFVSSLKGANGELIPIIFRPWHEHTGDWFWWGAGSSTVEEYVSLWRLTVEYLRDEKEVHNLLYAYSPDRVDTREAYLERYPGDEYVDVIGLDDYQALSRPDGVAVLARRLAMIVEIAEERGKIAALTETGLEGIPVADWWTGRLLAAIKADPVGQRIAWALVWRNANQADKPGHHYAPYPGHVSAEDFVAFANDPFVLMEDDLPDLYKLPE